MLFETFCFRRMSKVLAVLMCCVAVGCNNNALVSGRVTYSDNGEPVQSGQVIFMGGKEMGRAVIKDGRYSAGLLKDGEGLPPGTYTVSADALPPSSFELEMATEKRMGEETSPQEREVYYTKEPQSIEVKKSMTYDFVVERGTRP
jgi:hypothetical protein